MGTVGKGVMSCPPGQHWNASAGQCIPDQRWTKEPLKLQEAPPMTPMREPVTVPSGWKPQVKKERRTARAIRKAAGK